MQKARAHFRDLLGFSAVLAHALSPIQKDLVWNLKTNPTISMILTALL